MPNLNAATDPINDHKNGMIIMYKGTALDIINSIPNVKIVVGHGRPNVGAEG